MIFSNISSRTNILQNRIKYAICNFRSAVEYVIVSEYKLAMLSINKIQQDATVCSYLFTAKLLNMFWVSIAPIIRST